MTIALDARGCARAVIEMENDEPVPVVKGTHVSELLPISGGDEPWPSRLERLREHPFVSLRFEVTVEETRHGRPTLVPLRRAVRAVPVPGDDGVLESILLRLEVAHEVGALPAPDEERFRFLAETLPQMLWMARPEGTIEYLSPQWETFSGVPIARLLTDGYHSIIHPDDVAHLDATEIDDGSYVMSPFRMRRADGEYRWMEASIKSVRDTDGNLIRTVGTTADVTRRRQSEDERQVLTEQLRASLAVTGLGRFELDLATGGIRGDERLDEILGSPRNGPGGTRTLDEGLDLIHPEDREHVENAMGAAVEHGDDLIVEYRILRPSTDGPELRWITVRARAETIDGTAVRMVGVVGDVTERHAEDAARLRSQKREAIGTLAGGIAHDFNNVISAIWSNASVAETELKAGVSPETSIHEIKRGAERAADVVKRLLSFSREDKPERVPFDLVDVAQEACDLIRPTIDGGVVVEVHGAPGVRPVLGSASQLHQVIVNLVGNAAHAASDGGGHVWVDIDEIRTGVTATVGGPADASIPPGEYVRLRVLDDGPGIPINVMPRIFDPFFTTKAVGEGTGLGLAAAQSIVRAHGGDIWADNQAGALGAVFTVLLPMSDVAVDRDDATADAEHDITTTVTGPQILYVDDDPVLAKLAARALPLHGCGVTAFTDGAEALAALRENPGRFDAVVVDLAMPGVSGLDLVEAARRIRPDLAFIVSSGLVSGRQRDRATMLGVGAILPKPVSIQEVAEAVLRLTARQPTEPRADLG